MLRKRHLPLRDNRRERKTVAKKKLRLKWTDVRYGCTEAVCTPGFGLAVSWEQGGYEARAFGHILKEKFASLEDAQAAAEATAVRKLQDAMRAFS